MKVGCTYGDQGFDKDERGWKKSRELSPGTALGDGAFGDGAFGKGTARPEDPWFNKGRKVSALLIIGTKRQREECQPSRLPRQDGGEN